MFLENLAVGGQDVAQLGDLLLARVLILGAEEAQ
jgi:hypothetical protein